MTDPASTLPAPCRSGRREPYIRTVQRTLEEAESPMDIDTLSRIAGIGTLQVHNAVVKLCHTGIVDNLAGTGCPGIYAIRGRFDTRVPTITQRVRDVLQAAPAPMSLDEISEESGVSTVQVYTALMGWLRPFIEFEGRGQDARYHLLADNVEPDLEVVA